MKTNIILPIAGHGQRFIDGGFDVPKPLIEVDGKYILEKSLESIDTDNVNLIFIVRQEHVDSFNIDDKLHEKFGEDIKIIAINYTTAGAICTCLLAEELVNNDAPLAIFTPDCYFEPKINVDEIDEKYDGLVCVFDSDSDAHSYVKLNEDGFVTEAKEKEVISNNAVGGFYYFRTGKMFVKYANELVDRNMKTKGEFYICPVYNILLEDNLKIGIDINSKHIILGTPDDLLRYKKERTVK
jgi:choline kinase